MVIIIKSGITFIFKFHRRPIQLVVFVPVGLSSFLHLLQVLLAVELSSFAQGLQERTQLIEWDDGETCK